MKNKNFALITGASSGIGKELAIEHAKRKGNLILVARRNEKLNELKNELETKYLVQVVTIPMDLSATNSAENLYEKVKALNLNVDILINNAGFGGHGKFFERPWNEDKEMIQLNIVALSGLTRLFLDDMIKNKNGKIMNVASVAGFVPGPLQATYFATKSFVVSFTEALANELKGTPVTITALCPGATQTEFFEKANLTNTKLIQNAATAKSVAQFGYRALMEGKTIAIPGILNKFMASSPRFFPRNFISHVSRMVMEKAVH